jgi:hypothetical protein
MKKSVLHWIAQTRRGTTTERKITMMRHFLFKTGGPFLSNIFPWDEINLKKFSFVDILFITESQSKRLSGFLSFRGLSFTGSLQSL